MLCWIRGSCAVAALVSIAAGGARAEDPEKRGDASLFIAQEAPDSDLGEAVDSYLTTQTRNAVQSAVKRRRTPKELTFDLEVGVGFDPMHSDSRSGRGEGGTISATINATMAPTEDSERNAGRGSTLGFSFSETFGVEGGGFDRLVPASQEFVASCAAAVSRYVVQASLGYSNERGLTESREDVWSLTVSAERKFKWRDVATITPSLEVTFETPSSGIARGASRFEGRHAGRGERIGLELGRALSSCLDLTLSADVSHTVLSGSTVDTWTTSFGPALTIRGIAPRLELSLALTSSRETGDLQDGYHDRETAVSLSLAFEF